MLLRHSDEGTSVNEPKILFVGPRAIGASLAAWVAETYPAVFVMGHGASQAALRQNGITTYAFDQTEETRRTVRVGVVDRPRDVADADIVVVGGKNYSFAAVAEQVRGDLGDRPIRVSLANGIDTQFDLLQVFSNV